MEISVYKNYDIVNTQTDDESLKKIVDFFKKAFPASPQLTLEFLKWQYTQNPRGSAIGYNAFYKNNLVAHYVVIPAKAKIKGKSCTGYLSLNTATHPEHYYQGLFTHLAQKTYQKARDLGGEYVLGVGNLNSTHGLIHKLGFKYVSQLTNKIILCGHPKLKTNTDWEFETTWDEDAISWRLSGPNKPYQQISKENYNYIYAKTRKAYYKSLIGIFDKKMPLENDGTAFEKRRIRTFVGLPQCMNWAGTLSVNIPNFLRYTPLTLTIKDLVGSRTFSPEKIKFFSIDFDGY